jgi:glycerol uptake facilitator-like aquaporin
MVMLRQAPISAAVDAFILSAIFTVLIFTLRWSNQREWDDNDYKTALNAVLIGCLIITTLITLCDSTEIISGFFNPEY